MSSTVRGSQTVESSGCSAAGCLAAVYLGTSVVGYATSRPSRELIVAGHQQITQEWFARRANSYDLFVSQLVVGEAAQVDSDAAEQRAAFLQGILRLAVTDEAGKLATRLVASGTVPRQASEDALHVPVAAVHGPSPQFTG